MPDWNPFSKTYVVRCPGGSKKRVYKRPDDAFPLHLDRLELALVGGRKTEFLKLADRAEVNASFTKSVDTMLFRLNSRNEGLMLEFRAAYVVYQDDPCMHSKYLLQQVAGLIEEQRKLREFDAAMVVLAKLAESDLLGRQELSQRLTKILDNVDDRQKSEVTCAFDSSRQAVESLVE